MHGGGAAESSLLSAAISSSSDPDGMAGATRIHIGPGGALPPAWVDISEGVQADMERIKQKVRGARAAPRGCGEDGASAKSPRRRESPRR